MIALKILCQKAEVIGLMIFPTRAFVVFMVGYNVSLASNDWLDSTLLRIFDKRYGSKKIPMIRQGHCRHTQLDRSVHQAVHPATTIKQTIIGMDVQVHEVFI